MRGRGQLERTGCLRKRFVVMAALAAEVRSAATTNDTLLEERR